MRREYKIGMKAEGFCEERSVGKVGSVTSVNLDKLVKSSVRKDLPSPPEPAAEKKTPKQLWKEEMRAKQARKVAKNPPTLEEKTQIFEREGPINESVEQVLHMCTSRLTERMDKIIDILQGLTEIGDSEETLEKLGQIIVLLKEKPIRTVKVVKSGAPIKPESKIETKPDVAKKE